MLANMLSTCPKDTQREFPDEIRELVYFQQRKVCSVCGGGLNWSDAEIHHIVEHSMGGQTSLKNAALVHKVCHPKSEEKVMQFARE